MKTLSIVCGVILYCLSLQNVNAQCCAAGNPVGTNFNTNICNVNSLGLSIFYQYSYSDIYFEGNKISDFKYIDDSYFDFTSLNLNYGIFENFNVNAEIGFFFDKTQNFDFGDSLQFNRAAQGIGDASIGFQYIINVNDENSFSIIPGFRTTLPVGQFDQKDGAVILPIDIQPSSGSFKYEFGINAVYRVSNDFSLLTANTFEISQRIETERTNYKYGNLYNFSVFGIYNFIQKLTGILQLRAQYREKSSDRYRNLINSTGGFVLFVTPQMSYSIMDDLSIGFQYELPVYKNMNGIQLTNNYAFGFRISKSIGLQSEILNLTDKMPDSDLIIKEIQVNGLCEMCKERIENVAMEFENVKFADWNIETKILKIGYETEPDFDAIKKAIAKEGHDNETYTAADEDYNRLHSCCKYRK